MVKWVTALFFFLYALGMHSQSISVPVDLRQHNLTEYNSSFFNPVLSFYGNNPQSVAFWSRWQWQQVDADPTTLFLNYTRQINRESAAGLGFFQHNTGVYVNTGAVLNYAYIYNVSPELKIGVGLNFFGFKQITADNRFVIDPQIQLPQIRPTDDFIIQAAPGIFVKLKNLGIGLTSENLFDYNFTLKERQSSPEERVYLLSTAYDFHMLSNSAVLRPTVYWKSVPFKDNQLGLSTLFSTNKYWAQAGYNNFYGISVGGGGRFLKNISIGALMEFATDSSLDGIDPTFEIVAAYHFGKQFEEEEEEQLKEEELIVEQEEKSEEESEETSEPETVENETITDKEDIKTEKRRQEKEQEDLKRELRDALKKEEQRQKDSLQQAKKAQKVADKLAEEQARLEAQQKEEQEKMLRQKEAITAQQHIDSVDQVKIAANEELTRQRRIDSLNKIEDAAQRLKEKRQVDSLANLNSERIRRKENALAAQKRLDSMNQLNAEQDVVETEEVLEEVVLEKNEKYEEVATEDGLIPGFYLITNVFGTKKYYDAFMQDLTKKGLQPKSFLRSVNTYQYVYLERYDTMQEARKARNSKFFGKYPDAIWIFRVVGE